MIYETSKAKGTIYLLNASRNRNPHLPYLNLHKNPVLQISPKFYNRQKYVGEIWFLLKYSALKIL